MAIEMTKPILIVDDYKTMLRIIRNLLKQINLTAVDEAATGLEALEKLRGGDYGLVISDWNMEPMSGLQLLKQVRSDRRTETVPFLMVTQSGRSDHVLMAKQAGADGYIVKPFNALTLRDKVQAILDQPDATPA